MMDMYITHMVTTKIKTGSVFDPHLNADIDICKVYAVIFPLRMKKGAEAFLKTEQNTASYVAGETK